MFLLPGAHIQRQEEKKKKTWITQEKNGGVGGWLIVLIWIRYWNTWCQGTFRLPRRDKHSRVKALFPSLHAAAKHCCISQRHWLWHTWHWGGLFHLHIDFYFYAFPSCCCRWLLKNRAVLTFLETFLFFPTPPFIRLGLVEFAMKLQIAT